jgi:hypothetical protein
MVTREWSRSAQRISAGWLRDGVDAGRIPELAGLPAEVEAEAVALLALDVDPYASHPECAGATAPEVRQLEAGESVPFLGTIEVTPVVDGVDADWSFMVTRLGGSRIITRHGPLVLQLSPVGDLSRLCR